MMNREMSPQDRMRIMSEDYADLLVNYNGDERVFQQFEDATVHIINFFDAVVHVPVIQINDNTIVRWGYSVMPTLYGMISRESLEASGVLRLRNVPGFNLRGRGVLVGIMDSGIDYTNPVFINADNTTKIVSIWDQTINDDHYPGQTFYGTEYGRDQINEALQSENPLEIVPSTDEIGHGTMLAGIAAGNEVPENNFYGVAPDAELVVVKLKPAKRYLKEFFLVPEDVTCYQENDLIFGLEYLATVAATLNRPIAICIGLGSSAGAHDGRGTLSRYLSLVAQRSGTSVIVAAGNEGNARRHYYGRVNPSTGYDTVELSVGEGEEGFSMELWGDSPGVFSVDIQSPSGEFVPRVIPVLDETRTISFIFEETVIVVDYQMVESQSSDQLILMRFRRPTEGIWKFNVYGRADLNAGFNIWLPMTGFISNNTFFIRSDPYTTIQSLGNSESPITITAYNSVDDSLYIAASRGYSRIGTVKPEIAAPGVNIVAPSIDQGFMEVTGTSAAAAHTTGIAALLLEWAVVMGRQRNMNSVDMKIFMIRGARRDIDITYPNRDWGYGILDVFNIFDILRASQ